MCVFMSGCLCVCVCVYEWMFVCVCVCVFMSVCLFVNGRLVCVSVCQQHLRDMRQYDSIY